MAPSRVFLSRIDSGASREQTAAALAELWREAGFDRVFRNKDLAALKLHVGEPGTTTFVSPEIVAALVERIAAAGAVPFLTDTAVLYRSARDNAVGHIRVAREHGFGMERVGAPFIPADGLHGSDELEVEIGGKHFEKVAIASAIMMARSMLVLSHATGHLGSGYGGALKNIGMGCSSKKAKMRQHHGQQPRIDPDDCIACAECASWCPADAIAVNEHATIDNDSCIGCGECIAVCREGAVKFDWGIMGPRLQERYVEHAAGVIRAKRDHLCCVTVAQKITKNCDCLGVDEKPLLEDIGILASLDAVAIDRAVLDLVEERAGRSLESMSYPNVDGSVQIDYAASLGLGSGSYELITL
jgi:uncharacterized Fe-S center protein